MSLQIKVFHSVPIMQRVTINLGKNMIVFLLITVANRLQGQLRQARPLLVPPTGPLQDPALEIPPAVQCRAQDLKIILTAQVRALTRAVASSPVTHQLRSQSEGAEALAVAPWGRAPAQVAAIQVPVTSPLQDPVP